VFETPVRIILVALQPATLFERKDGAADLGLVHGGMRTDRFRCHAARTAERGKRAPFRPGQSVFRLVMGGEAQADEFGGAVEPVGEELFEFETIGRHDIDRALMVTKIMVTFATISSSWEETSHAGQDRSERHAVYRGECRNARLYAGLRQ
jgi:hypothetical protein